MALTTTVPLLISQQFDSEVVLANYQNGVYYNLDGSAAQIWLGLKVNRTVEEIGSALAAATNGDVTSITQQVQAFVDSMLAEGLIAIGTADSRSETPNEIWTPVLSGAFVAPEFQRFDNLRELLLMDPVHDAGEQGWPLRESQ
ncbi:PqqD family protein [Bradyrhizobium manausense]|uniref:PqqD family protein n=1 Tax=Bradyrhizobium manausense TaxID=989370 RepID=UPI001BA887CC|nr:PqqD family protein [Bradyrhizobium manausense]MBR0688792.1 PqqD family protein [Bradyrhizobium manausense]MBR0723604.1 PqqD family protein [Bradyrhizobium manausense]MBR0836646.1 PqqD family protein [Bradyrhizobium manausense]